ncbi:MAG: hypothetical protein CVV21_02000 [Candidatus Goldiibacteriota bacterium HGW-Goldbacteria-1]|jgi:flagellar L-ring protein precursor FlgH|nr:MAG: hypothetical protein CVV21_02000 [Candidatus Goldiibacteriota bacterium HGW-Goldbacteria-1]
MKNYIRRNGMAKKTLTFLITAAFVILFAGISAADDIAINTDDMGSMYTDHKAYRVGDIVTVLVVESTQAVQSASLKTNKKAGLEAGMGMSNWANGVSTSFPNVPSWGMGAEEYQDGGGKTQRSGSLLASISARVEKVLSNGNLYIKGTKVIQINDDKQNLIIKGVIRPEDIASNNTIYSTNVADAMIEYEGNGPIGEKTSPGILTRFFDWIGLF